MERLQYRPLEGFVYAISQFTAIAGNLSASAAMMGNVSVWKPSDHQIFSAKGGMAVFREAGLPAGVLNMVMGDPEMVTQRVLASPDFAGIHYTGSTFVFKSIWEKIGNNIKNYKSYPKIVGETGGKDLLLRILQPSPNKLQQGSSVGLLNFKDKNVQRLRESIYLLLSLKLF